MVGKKSAEYTPPAQLPGRNDPCHCGSGKKYKKCHEDKDASAKHAILEKQWTAAEKEAAQKAEDDKESDNGTNQHPDEAYPSTSCQRPSAQYDDCP